VTVAQPDLLAGLCIVLSHGPEKSCHLVGSTVNDN